MRGPRKTIILAAGRRDLAWGKFGGFHKGARRPQISQATEGQHLQKQSFRLEIFARKARGFHFSISLLQILCLKNKAGFSHFFSPTNSIKCY